MRKKNYNLKTWFQSSSIPPDYIQGKEHTIMLAKNALGKKTISESKLSYVLLQLQFISPKLWITQITTIIIMLVTLSLLAKEQAIQLSQIPNAVFILTPILCIYAIPELLKSNIYKMEEIEMVCKVGLRKTVLIRMFLVGTITLFFLLFTFFILSIQYHLPYYQLLLYGLFAYNTCIALTLLISRISKMDSLQFLFGVISIITILMNLLVRLGYFTIIVSLIGCIISGLILLYEEYKLFEGRMHIWN